MKTIFRNLGLGILMAGCVAISGTQTFAQDAAADVCKEVEPQQALYKQFTENIVKGATIAQTETAIKAGDEYLQKYGACLESKQIVDYLNQYLPGMKKTVASKKKDEATGAVLARFDAAAKAKNISEISASGKEILTKEADFDKVSLDVALTLASAGFEQSVATPPVDTYNADTISYAKNAIQKIEAGKTSTNWGVWSYNFKNDKFQDKKSYTLGALNYIIGNVTYYRLGKDNPDKKKEALTYFYKATQYDSFSKTDPTIYQAIGAWYLDEAIKIDKARQVILTANGNKDNDETLAMVASQKGYADRSIDAYSRAYKYAKDDKAQKKEYVDGLYTRLKELYAFRYDGKITGIDEFVATVQSKPMPDPTTAVTPVIEATPDPATTTGTTTTPTTTTTTTNTTKPATNTTTPNTTKPTTTPVKKPVSTNVTPVDSTTPDETAATTKTKVKKPVSKKKGTR